MKTVVVGMSGGVDSSVAAYLLKQKGYKVIGLFMKNWESQPNEECSSEIDFKDAEKVCDILNIPLHRANFSDDYWEKVFRFFLSEHKKGRTPNPDILCNREIKFRSFYDYAMQIGADYIATGHYADTMQTKEGTFLKRAKDLNKDQTYFLHEVSQKEFAKTIFPLSKLLKTEVRDIAKNISLPIFDKKDSVGICFVGEKNLKDFLKNFISFKRGNIKSSNGEILGKHNGSILYTIGQRQGLGIGGVKNKDELPWYVYDKNTELNEVYVCQGVDNQLLFSKNITIKNIHWINKEFYGNSLFCKVQIRHRQTPSECKIIKNKNSYQIEFESNIRGAAPGQSAVFYQDSICLGGGIIETVSKSI